MGVGVNLVYCLPLQMQYTFQQVFDEYTTQKAMFDVVAMSLVEDVLRGKNGQFGRLICGLCFSRHFLFLH